MTTYVRLDQIRKAFDFDDTLTSSEIQSIETNAIDHQDFLHGMLSQINKIIGDTNWHDPVQSAALDPRNLKTITDDIYYKDMLRWRVKSQDISVGASDNFVVLSVASSEALSETAAVGAGLVLSAA